MARKWELKGLHTAKKYIKNKIVTDIAYFFHLESDKQEEAIKELELCDTAPKMQKWVEKYLLPDQIRNLRTYLRVEKSRSRRLLQNITLKAETRERLANYAKCYNITLSEAIDKLLDECDKKGKLF